MRVVRFRAVGAVRGCIGMINVRGAWLTGGLNKELLFLLPDANCYLAFVSFS